MSSSPTSILLIIGIVLVVIGFSTKNSFEKQDLQRTVTKFPVKITKVTKYDVTYSSSNPIMGNITLHGMDPSNIKNVGDSYPFEYRLSNNLSKKIKSITTLPIAEIKKTPSEIQVDIIQDGISKSGFISKKYFNRDIEDKDVSSTIEIEFDPNDLTNISMSIDGLTFTQNMTCWGMIGFGILLIIAGLYNFFKK